MIKDIIIVALLLVIVSSHLLGRPVGVIIKDMAAGIDSKITEYTPPKETKTHSS